MKVAIVHDWLVSYRGGEKVLQAICEMYPDAPIYTLFYDSKELPEFFHKREIRYPKTLNGFRKIRKALLPILPIAIESLDLSGFDLVISTSSCVAKGVIVDPYAKHVCYIHSPMRYIWDQRKSYFKKIEKIPIVRSIFYFLTTGLRQWDSTSAQRVHKFIANSSFVKERVKNYYNKESEVIHPPLGFDNLNPVTKKSDYYLVAGAMVPYKKFDLAIEACRIAGKKIIVAGKGPESNKLKEKFANLSMVEFVDAPDDAKFVSLLQNAKGLIFPGVEDFGMIAIEAMACGTPVIAYAKGGAKDFIVDEKTGIFFEEQPTENLTKALERFESLKFSTDDLSEFTKQFQKDSFKKSLSTSISKLVGA